MVTKTYKNEKKESKAPTWFLYLKKQQNEPTKNKQNREARKP
jgi:hypothetical protein